MTGRLGRMAVVGGKRVKGVGRGKLARRKRW